MKKNNENVHEMSRQQAARFIDEMRLLLAKMKDDPRSDNFADSLAMAHIKHAMDAVGLPEYKRCTGEAHGNAFIDHCGVCMNAHWGFSGKNVKVK